MCREALFFQPIVGLPNIKSNGARKGFFACKIMEKVQNTQEERRIFPAFRTHSDMFPTILVPLWTSLANNLCQNVTLGATQLSPQKDGNPDSEERDDCSSGTIRRIKFPAPTVDAKLRLYRQMQLPKSEYIGIRSWKTGRIAKIRMWQNVSKIGLLLTLAILRNRSESSETTSAALLSTRSVRMRQKRQDFVTVWLSV